MAALAVVPMTSRPLYETETDLAGFVETAEMVTPEREQEFLEEFSAALQQAVEKRDRVGNYFGHLESQISFADAEIKRLQEKKSAYKKAFERLERYVIAVIKSLDEDAKGKWKKLEGRTVIFSLRNCPVSVEILNEAEVPADYKTLTVKLPAPVWEDLLDRLQIEERSKVLGQVKFGESYISKTQVKQAFDKGVRVPGCDLAINEVSLVRK